jgi:hypothetical protein
MAGSQDTFERLNQLLTMRRLAPTQNMRGVWLMKRPTRLIIVIAVLLVPLTLAGCGLSPDKTVAKFLDAFKAADSEEMSKYVLGGDISNVEDLDEEDPELAEVALSILSKLTYSIQKPAINGNTATVPVNMTSIDIPRLMANLIPQMFGAALTFVFSQENPESMIKFNLQLVKNAINDPDVPMTTTPLDFPLIRTNGKWLIVFDEEFAVSLVNAYSGNMGNPFDH